MWLKEGLDGYALTINMDTDNHIKNHRSTIFSTNQQNVVLPKDVKWSSKLLILEIEISSNILDGTVVVGGGRSDFDVEVI
jgi:hypothetical protein